MNGMQIISYEMVLYRVYIVMEYAENGSLLDIIRKDQHIDEMRGRRWFRQLVEAVEYCHERGVVHRYLFSRLATSI